MQQEEKEQHQRAGFNYMLMRMKKHKKFRFSKLMCSHISESQSEGEGPHGSTAQPALLLVQIDFWLKTYNKKRVRKCIEDM